MLRILVAVCVAALVAGVATLATEPVRPVGARAPLPPVGGESFHAPQRNGCSLEAGAPHPSCRRDRPAPLRRPSEVRLASSSAWSAPAARPSAWTGADRGREA